MKKVTVTVCILASAAAMIFSGCQKENGGSGKSGSDTEASADADKNFENGEAPEDTISQADQETKDDPGVEETDWSAFFEGLNGSAVLYDPA